MVNSITNHNVFDPDLLLLHYQTVAQCYCLPGHHDDLLHVHVQCAEFNARAASQLANDVDPLPSLWRNLHGDRGHRQGKRGQGSTIMLPHQLALDLLKGSSCGQPLYAGTDSGVGIHKSYDLWLEMSDSIYACGVYTLPFKHPACYPNAQHGGARRLRAAGKGFNQQHRANMCHIHTYKTNTHKDEQRSDGGLHNIHSAHIHKRTHTLARHTDNSNYSTNTPECDSQALKQHSILDLERQGPNQPACHTVPLYMWELQ